MRSISDKELNELYQDRLKDHKIRKKSRKNLRMDGKPHLVSSVLEKVFKENSQALRKIHECQALMAWSKFVGKAASMYSRAQYIRKNQLVVYVEDPLWMNQLYLLKNGLLKKYQQYFPRLNIRDIYFTRNS